MRSQARAARMRCRSRSASSWKPSVSSRRELLRVPPAVLGFRSAAHAEAAALLPGAEVAIDPTLVTELIPAGHEVLACGPEPMLHAVARQCPGAQLAWEAPMACGYGGCYGCAVEVDGQLK